ncbi:MYND finger [Musa troglodytarum]|uniref:MYND finger n=1 Tax=Musa troglodytarum TaxID=320322 RepID=A0A9E7F6G0_9LILI|nr:MYND finger [Musa troglodytarum]
MASSASAERRKGWWWRGATECAARGSGTPCAPGPPTRRCGLCGAVAYCSTAHQISHWIYHKKECRRLEEQMRHVDILSDFPFTFFIEDINQASRCSFFTSKGLHQIGLWKSECSCGSLAVSMNELWLNDDWSLPSSLCPCVGIFSLSLILQSGFFAVFKLASATTLNRTKKSTVNLFELLGRLLRMEMSATPFASRIITSLEHRAFYRRYPANYNETELESGYRPLTVYHCFQLLAAQSSISEVKDELNIHYLGPEKELLQLGVFGELLALFSGVQIHMDLVGPAVPQFRDGKTVSLCKYLSCAEQDCICKSSCADSSARRLNGKCVTVHIKLHKGFYHDICRNILKDSYPHLIIAPNAGVAAYSSWSPTIELIKEMGIPAIFTDFCEEAANLAADCISTVTSLPLRLPIQINPFRQPMVVEDSALYLPCYSNCFLFGM